MTENRIPEPWLRGTLTEVHPVLRAVLHAIELAKEDLQRWCGPLTDDQLNARPGGVPSVAFHMRHIARSVDRLLTYAEGKELDERQLKALAEEAEGNTSHAALFEELERGLDRAASRIRQLGDAGLETPRYVGRKRLPTTVAGLLVHIADHTQRHIGQAITTAKIVTAVGGPGEV